MDVERHMSSERYALFLFWAGLFIVLASLFVMLAFVLVLPALAKEIDPPRELTVQDCQELIRNDLRCMSAAGIQYAAVGEQVAYPSSGVFVENGYAARDNLNGILFWAMQVEGSLDQCVEQPWYDSK
jgi:hypothetical protein